MFKFASQTKVILISFALMILFGASLGFLQNAIGGEVLDNSFGVAANEKRLGELSPDARKVHAWGTLTLDIAFPVATAFFLAGVIFRFGPRRVAFWLACLPVAAMVFDLLENVTIVMALQGNEEIIPAKSGLTLIKAALVVVSMMLAMVLLITALVKRFMPRRDD